MRRDSYEVGLLPIVIGNFEEPSAVGLSRLGRSIEYPCLDRCFDVSGGAEPLPASLSSANDVGPPMTVGISLFHRVKSKETRIVRSLDANLFADIAADSL
jgi:hypothetical protein